MRPDLWLRLPIIIAVLSAFPALSGCGARSQESADRIIAYVNKEPIFAKDLRRELALRARQDPTFRVTPETEAAQLDLIINRKLIVQAAIEKGLAKEGRFVNTIKSFWEQTLIRDFFDYKRKDFHDYLFATDDEIRKYYGLLSKRVTFAVFQGKNKRDADRASEEYTKTSIAQGSGWRTVGPISYEDIEREVLFQTFDAPAGELRRFDETPFSYLVVVTKVETVDLGAFDSVRDDIERKIIAIKERRLFNEWLKESRLRSRIKIIP